MIYKFGNIINLIESFLHDDFWIIAFRQLMVLIKKKIR